MLKTMEQMLKAFKFIQKVANKDYFMSGILGGIAGTLAMDAFNLVAWRWGKTESLYGHFGGSVLMQPLRTKRMKNFILGEMVHLIHGAGLGLPTAYLFKKTGTKFHLIKGASMGLFAWLGVYSLGKRAHIFSINPRMARTHYAELISNIIYGMVSAQAIVSFSPDLFPTAVAQLKTQSTSPVKCEEDQWANEVMREAKAEFEESLIH